MSRSDPRTVVPWTSYVSAKTTQVLTLDVALWAYDPVCKSEKAATSYTLLPGVERVGNLARSSIR